jgi:exopolysaccharide production protein ExoQ
MPPVLALTLCLSFSLVLLVRESYQQKNVSRAVWIPCIWLLILGSRPISQWFSVSGPSGFDSMMEGSPVDRVVYMILMLAGLVVVLRRGIRWREAVTSNPFLICFIVYCAISVAWSDFQFIAFKRWFKSLGDPLMALVLLSEPAPAAAIASVLRRCAFVLVPLSVVFIKYLPQLGRIYDAWSGYAFYTGVTTNKNMLGYLLLVFGLLFFCTVLTRRARTEKTDRAEIAIALVFLGMIAWLIRMADSQTAVVTLGVSGAVVVALGSMHIRNYFGGVALVLVCISLALQWLFNVGGFVLESIGRDATLTGRTEIWAAVLELARNPIGGAGFQSFWLGPRLVAMWTKFPVFLPNQAHNGYIEIYLNLGWIGLLLFGGVLISFYRLMHEKLDRAMSASPIDANELIIARFAVGYLVAYVLYNVTEAIFQPLHFLFIVFLMLGIRYSTHAVKVPALAASRGSRWGHPFAEPAAISAARTVQWQPGAARSATARQPWGRTESAASRPPARPAEGPPHLRNWHPEKPMTSWKPSERHRGKSSR